MTAEPNNVEVDFHGGQSCPSLCCDALEPLPPFTIRFVRFVAKYSRNVGTIKRRMSH
jgi:hypothetical protein